MNIKYVALAIIIIVVIVGGWYFLRSSSAPVPTYIPGTPAATATTTKAFSLEVQKRKLVSGTGTLVVKQGDNVSITITADESDELHLHGYDLHTDFSTGTPATISFTASQSGRFPFEMEGSKTDLGELDVQP